MKKKVLALASIIIFSCSSSLASPVVPGPVKQTTVLVLPVVDKSGLKYSKKELVPIYYDKIEEMFPESNFRVIAGKDAEMVVAGLKALDIAKLERQELIRLGRAVGADYVILNQIERFQIVGKSWGFFVTYNTVYARFEMRGKVVDISNDIYLYNDFRKVEGKNVSSAVGGAGVPSGTTAAKHAISKAMIEWSQDFDIEGKQVLH